MCCPKKQTKKKGKQNNDTFIILSLTFKNIKIILSNVRTRFGLNPKTGMDPGPQSPNNKFVECGINS